MAGGSIEKIDAGSLIINSAESVAGGRIQGVQMTPRIPQWLVSTRCRLRKLSLVLAASLILFSAGCASPRPVCGDRQDWEIQQHEEAVKNEAEMDNNLPGVLLYLAFLLGELAYTLSQGK